MENYFQSAGLIHLGVQIVDARHKPTADDVTMHDYFVQTGCPVVIVANKLDKLKAREIEPNLAQIRETLHLVDRMVAVESSDQAAVCMPDFDPAEYVRKIFGMYPDDLCTVELLCENEVMRSVIDRFGEDVSTMTADDGHFKAIVEVAPSPPFFAWVFTFCGKIQILGPAEVLDEMRGMAAWLQ